jgi:hypothetical protein
MEVSGKLHACLLYFQLGTEEETDWAAEPVCMW